MQGTDVLAQSREVYPLARRVLLTAYSDIDAAIKAINVAHLDHYLSKPWDPPEECLFPVDRRSAGRLAGRVSSRGQGPAAGRAPVVAALARDQGLSRRQSDPVSLARRGARPGHAQPARRGRDRRDELPALFFEDGSVLRNPERREVAERLGRSLSAALESVRPRDRGRRSRRAGGGGVRRVRRVADAAARSARTRRAGRHQLPNRELPRLSRPASAAAN